ncbi:MAG: alpha/beta hydrolase family esterase [Ilumatobacteraceae bacterium]
MRRFEVLFTSIALIALAGCTSTTDTGNADGALVASTEAVVSTTTAEPSPVAEPSVASVVPPGFESITTADGRIRSYRIVDLSNGEPAPLLFVLHGFGGTAAMMSESSEIDQTFADRYDLHPVVVYPNGTGAEDGLPQSWNAGNCCPFSTFDLVDDVAFFDQLITDLTARYDIDPERVWVVGHSNGGMMAYRLACELSTRITAIGVAAGAMMIDSCSPTQPVSALHVHGELDTVVPLLGGDIAGIVFPSARQSVDVFTRNGNGVAELVTDPAWTHDWQPDWTALFAEFLAAQ